MNLQQLEALADAAANEPAPYVRAEAQQQFRSAANPATIKALVVLCRLQHEALVYEERPWNQHIRDEAIAAFERFNGEAE